MFRTEILKLSALKYLSKENPLVASVLKAQKQWWLRRSKRGYSDFCVWHCHADFRWTNLSAIRMFFKAQALRAGFVLRKCLKTLNGSAQISWQEDAELGAAMAE